MTDFIIQFIEEFQLPLENPVLIFSLVLLIILLSPILLRKLNIPGIIGLIISGVIIGPHGLGILANDSAIELFSTIGLLYIMFIAGLELDLNEFKANRNKSLLFGLFTFTIPLAIGFPVMYYLLGYEFNTSLLTASMFATHTLVAYPIVSKFGVSKNQAVAITVGGTILTDTAVLIILAVIVGSSHGGLTQEFWIRLGVSLTIFTAIIFLVVPRIARWFFRKLESEKHSHYIFVLSVVFFAAFLAEVAGVEPIIGAFFAGLALNKLIPSSSPLMNRIEFIGNSLFIPFFLISVGMIVDVRVIMSGPMALIIAGTLSVVAIFSKWVAAIFTQLVFKYSRAQGQLIFGLSSAHAAATLAVILVGFNAGIIDENILNGTVILILITCIVASFATEQAAKKLVVSSEDEEEIKPGEEMKAEQILLPIANLDNIQKLLEYIVLIKDKKSPNPVSVLSVVSNDEEAERNIIRTRNKFEEIVRQGAETETNIDIITTIDHNVASGISRISREVMADMIILGWPERAGIIAKLIGEKLDSILSNTDKTVMISHIAMPLMLHKRILLVVPPFAEHENGFKLWLTKITQLAQEISGTVLLFSNNTTETAINKLLKSKKITLNIKHTEFNDWDDALILARYIEDDDFLVLVSARRGAASHMSILDRLPLNLEKHFFKNSRVVVYPQQNSSDTSFEQYRDFTTDPISKGLEATQKLSKRIGSILKSKK